MRNVLLLIAPMVLVLAVSCLFDTREAQPPGSGTTSCTLETSEKVFLCMTTSLEARRDSDYENSISSNFNFLPLPADENDEAFAGIPVYENWTKDVEMEVVGILIGDATHIDVDFGTPEPLINQATYVQYKTTYALAVVNNATPTDTTTYRGIAHIDVRNEGGNWRVTLWEDVEGVEGSRTWGYLRGIIRLPLVP